MPSAREMLQIVAEDPVAQARYFIVSMRLFCEHGLGTGPIDDFLRHNGPIDGVQHADKLLGRLSGSGWLEVGLRSAVVVRLFEGKADGAVGSIAVLPMCDDLT